MGKGEQLKVYNRLEIINDNFRNPDRFKLPQYNQVLLDGLKCMCEGLSVALVFIRNNTLCKNLALTTEHMRTHVLLLLEIFKDISYS